MHYRWTFSLLINSIHLQHSRHWQVQSRPVTGEINECTACSCTEYTLKFPSVHVIRMRDDQPRPTALKEIIINRSIPRPLVLIESFPPLSMFSQRRNKLISIRSFPLRKATNKTMARALTFQLVVALRSVRAWTQCAAAGQHKGYNSICMVNLLLLFILLAV